MSLYESKDSTGDVSITDMINDTIECKYIGKCELPKLASLIIRGGWPANINIKSNDYGIIPKSYIDSVINNDVNERKDKKRNPNKMRMLLRSLSRNESSITSIDKIIKDIEEYETSNDMINSRITVEEYIGSLNSINLISNQEAFSINYRSSKRIGKSAKRHLVDPSLACASLDLTVEKLMNDLNTFGFMFESLVERDLLIYSKYLDANLFHFRDNVSGDEIDAVMEFRDGQYGIFEIKLGPNRIDEAKESLLKFYNNVNKKPKFMCIIVRIL